MFFSFTLSQTHHDREMLNKLSVIICCERLRNTINYTNIDRLEEKDCLPIVDKGYVLSLCAQWRCNYDYN